MTDVDEHQNHVQDLLLSLERERCEAVTALDHEALDRILGADLTHTHVNGLTQTKSEYLAALGGRPRTVTRSGLSVQVIGDVALMRGRLQNSFDAAPASVPARQLQVLQVWVLRESAWQMIAFSCSGPLPESPGPSG